MDRQHNAPLKQTWQAQIRQLASHNPRLAQQFWQNRQVYFARFIHFYHHLADLPRKFRRKFLKRLATTLAGAALLLALGQAIPARAAVITVDGVVCTLAEAIDSANNDNAAGNGCVDGSGADVIDLQMDVMLSAPLPAITSQIILEGNGHVLDGNNWTFQVLNVAVTGNLTLNEATITNGYAYDGAGILNSGTLTVNNSVFDDNFAYGYFLSGGGGIYNKPGGTVTINDSTFIYNWGGGGGALWNSGTMQVNNSTISENYVFAEFGGSGGGGICNRNTGILTINNSNIRDNIAFDGGGISNRGTLILQNSTVTGNSVDFDGGGFVNINGSITLNNSTLSGNSAYRGGGIYNWNGIVTVNSSTISGNISSYGEGGGIFNKSGNTVNLNLSLISGNSGGVSGAEVYNLGTVNANNFNVIGYSSDPRSFGFNPGPNDIIPSGALDTVLDINLADNGGPAFTHALVSGSDAIDIAPNDDCTVPPINGLDQRGFPRNLDGDGIPSANECDAGAFEFDPGDLPTPTATATQVFRPTKTAEPTSTPITRTPPAIIPTRTPTPRVTQSITRTPTSTPQANANLPNADEKTSTTSLNWIVMVIVALANFFFLSKNRT